MRLAALLGPMTLALTLGAPSSYALVQPAMAGHPWPWPTTDTCLTSPAWDMITNSCNDQVVRLLVVPMQIGATGGGGSVHAYAHAKANPFGTSDTTCQAIGIGPDNLSYYFSSNKNTFSTSVVTLDLGSVNIPSNGTLHFECNLGWHGGSVVNVEIQ